MSEVMQIVSIRPTSRNATIVSILRLASLVAPPSLVGPPSLVASPSLVAPPLSHPPPSARHTLPLRSSHPPPSLVKLPNLTLVLRVP